MAIYPYAQHSVSYMVAARAVIIIPCMLSTYNMADVNYRFLKIYFARTVTGSSVWQCSFPHYYGTNNENSELIVHSYGWLDIATYFYDSLVIMLRRPIKRRLMSQSQSSESLARSSDSFVNPPISCYLALHSRRFIRHLVICNQMCVKLLQLMCAVITHNSVTKQSLCIIKWLSYSQL